MHLVSYPMIKQAQNQNEVQEKLLFCRVANAKVTNQKNNLKKKDFPFTSKHLLQFMQKTMKFCIQNYLQTKHLAKN